MFHVPFHCTLQPKPNVHFTRQMYLPGLFFSSKNTKFSSLLYFDLSLKPKLKPSILPCLAKKLHFKFQSIPWWRKTITIWFTKKYVIPTYLSIPNPNTQSTFIHPVFFRKFPFYLSYMLAYVLLYTFDDNMMISFFYPTWLVVKGNSTIIISYHIKAITITIQLPSHA